MFACNRCSKRTFLPSRRMSRTSCLPKALKLTARFHYFSKRMIATWIIAETPGIVNIVLGFFARGGLFMWPLLACSIVSVTTMILRGLVLRRKKGDAADNRRGNRTSGTGRKP